MYCECGIVGASRPIIQLLRHGWWPATMAKPRTVVTLNAVQQFHAITLLGKLNIYDYYQSLVQLTDNVGVRNVPVSYFTLYASMC